MKHAPSACLPLLLFFGACSGPEVLDDPDELASGRVIQDGAPVANVVVTVDGEDVAVTGADGRFDVGGLDEGSHVLLARLDGAGDRFEQRTIGITVTGMDDDLGDVALPAPVELAATAVHAHSIELGWSADAGEYDLLRGWAPQYDPETWRPLLVDSTATTFHDADDYGTPLWPQQAHYYRVEADDLAGGLARSGVVEITTLEWDQTEFSQRYELEQVSSFGGEGDIGGIAWDGSALWIVYREAIGGYYENDLVTLVRREPTTGAHLAEFTFTDMYAEIHGLAWDGTSVWIAHVGTGQQIARRIDTTTGAVLATLALPDGTVDLAWDGSHLLIADTWDHIDVVDPSTGAAVGQYVSPFLTSTQRGVTWRDGHLWVSSWMNDDIAILDADGVHVGLAHTDLYGTGWWFESGLFMTFAGDELALVIEDRVYLLALVPVEIPS